MTHYDTLEVSPRASAEVVRAAYRSLIQRCHPDRHPDDPAAARRAAELTQAYQVLSDAQQREAYDRTLGAAAAATAIEREHGVATHRGTAPRSTERHRGAARPAPGDRSAFTRRATLPGMAAAALAVVAFATWLALQPSPSPAPVAGSRAPGAVHQEPADFSPAESARRERLARQQRLLRLHPGLPDTDRPDEGLPLAALTVELLDQPFVVTARGHELTLRRVQAVVGSVDAALLRIQLLQQRDRWQSTLGRQLAREDVALWRGEAGEARLGKLVARVLNETLGTPTEEGPAATEFQASGRSGVVAVRLPDGVDIGP